MLFRIEDSANIKGKHREYNIPEKDLPELRVTQLESYIATEIRKEVNNSKDRSILSYSKSLGVCLLKYNKFTDNQLRINNLCVEDFVFYYVLKSKKYKCKTFNLKEGIKYKKNRKIRLINFKIDISNNILLDEYMRKETGIGLKKVASPEKDKEVLLMQSPNDMVIACYLESVYLLYALYLKYGMNEGIYNNLLNKISTLEDFRFECCGESERDALIAIVNYLYYNGEVEKEMSQKIYQDSSKSEEIPFYYNPILQLHDIQIECFNDSYMLSDYNGNIISDWIWEFYKSSTVIDN